MPRQNLRPCHGKENDSVDDAKLSSPNEHTTVVSVGGVSSKWIVSDCLIAVDVPVDVDVAETMASLTISPFSLLRCLSRSLPLGQQLCGNRQSQILPSFYLLHVPFMHLFLHTRHDPIL